MRLLDEVGDEALVIGAVNTVARRGSVLVGYNTDYLGVIECLRGLRPRRALVIGAGGAARAVIYALHRLGLQGVTIANRSRERARRLASWAAGLGLDTGVVGLGDAASVAGEADIVVNATPLGSKACCPDEAPPVLSSLGSGQVVFDLVYNPVETRLIREARRRGAKTITGLCMLIWQALHADRIWLGIEPARSDYEYIERRVLERLRQGEPP